MFHKRIPRFGLGGIRPELIVGCILVNGPQSVPLLAQQVAFHA